MLRTVNEGALTILNDDFAGLIGEAVDQWPRQNILGQFIRHNFATAKDVEWQTQVELERPNGMPQVLLLRGSRLPEASGGGDVVVFDDVTRIVAAQRSAAWGEVARRLAHEIKNPLTPIQLVRRASPVQAGRQADERRRRHAGARHANDHQPGAGDEADGQRFPRLCAFAGA